MKKCEVCGGTNDSIYMFCSLDCAGAWWERQCPTGKSYAACSTPLNGGPITHGGYGHHRPYHPISASAYPLPSGISPRADRGG